jgi:PTS system nitrogen regulatory IIA component
MATKRGQDARTEYVIARHLSPADVLLDVDADNKAQVFAQIARRAERRHGASREAVYEALCAREGYHSTALGRGIAIPHARVSGLRDAIAMFVRTRNPLEFDADDGKPVTQMLMLLVPESATERHLQLLAETAQLFCDRRFREQLRIATDADAIYRLFADGTGD